MRFASIVVLALLMLAVRPASLLAQSGGHAKDEAAIRGVVQKYLDSREQNDPESLATLFVDDVDQLVSSGVWRRGRGELVKGTLASSENNSGKRTLNVETIRFVTPDVVIADARYEIVGADGAAARKMWSTFVMRRGGSGWQIAAIRNMLPAGNR